MAIRAWLLERTPLASIEEAIAHKSVPRHRYSVFYFLGGMTLFFFGVQVVTGALLLLYYRPSASEAYESVGFIMTRVPFGWLVRSVHAWSANLMIGAAFAHLFSVIYVHAYRPPRELTWVSGLLVFFITFAFGFSGYLLPWNELAFFATRVGTNMAGVVPGIGDSIVHFMRGGKDVSGATLTRFFGVHVAILPAITTALLAMHLVLVQYHGMSVPPSEEARVKQTGKPGPEHAVRAALRAAGPVRVDRRARAARGAVGVHAVGAGPEGGRLRGRAGRHPAGVVFPVDVPGAQVRAGHRSRRER